MRLHQHTTAQTYLATAQSHISAPLQTLNRLFSALFLAGLFTSVSLMHAAPAHAEVAKAAVVAEPKTELTPEFIYKYLIGEVAGQRGDFATSGAIFYDLAQSTRDPRLAERAAKVAAYGNVSNLAIPAVTLWSELDTESNEAQQAMTEMLVATGRIKEAEPYLAKLLAKDDNRANGFLYLNNILNRSVDKTPILGVVQSLAKPYPTLAEAHFAIAQAAWAANQDALALKSLDKAEALKPGWHVAALFKGQLLFAKSPQEAIYYYQSFLKDHPAANEVRITLAKLLVSEKQYAAAKQEFSTITYYAKDGDPASFAEATAVLGLLSYQSTDYKAADSYFMQALELDFKDEEQLYLYLGQSAERQNRDDVANNWYNKVLPGDHYLEAQFNSANLVARTQGTDKAIEQLDNVDNLTVEQQILVIQTQAVLYGKAKRHQEAFDLLEKAVKNMPNTAELVYDYALAAEHVKKLDLMEAELRKVIAAKPNFAPAYNALGYSFADRNIKLDEAQKLIETALSMAPNDHYMLDSLGWVHYRKGNLDQAIMYLKQAYAVNPDPEIAAHLGEALWQKGQHDEAKRIWNDALANNPDNEVLMVTANKFKS